MILEAGGLTCIPGEMIREAREPAAPLGYLLIEGWRPALEQKDPVPEW